MDKIHIKFLNWDTYQTKTTKTPFYFRIHHKLENHVIWDELPPAGFKLLLFLLMRASEAKTRGFCTISVKSMALRTGIRPSSVRDCLACLEQNQVIKCSPRGVSEEPTPYIEQNSTAEYRTEQNRTGPSSNPDEFCPEATRLIEKLGSVLVDETRMRCEDDSFFRREFNMLAVDMAKKSVRNPKAYARKWFENAWRWYKQQPSQSDRVDVHPDVQSAVNNLMAGGK